MNWVGGIKRRILLQEEEKRRQDQFFALHSSSAAKNKRNVAVNPKSFSPGLVRKKKEDFSYKRIQAAGKPGNRNEDEKGNQKEDKNVFINRRLRLSSIHGPFSEMLLRMEYEGTKKKLKEKKRNEKYAKKYSFIDTNNSSHNGNSIVQRKTYSQIMENDSGNKCNASRSIDFHSQSCVSTSSNLSSSFVGPNSLKNAPKIRRLNTLSPNHFKNKLSWSSIPESTEKKGTAHFLRRNLVSSSMKRNEKKLPSFDINSSFERNVVSNLLGFPVEREKEKHLEKNDVIPVRENSSASKIHTENFIFTNERQDLYSNVTEDTQLQFVRRIESTKVSRTEAYENPFRSDKSLQLFSHAAYQIDYKSVNIRESFEPGDEKVIKNISLNRSFSIHEVNKRNANQIYGKDQFINKGSLTPSLKKTVKQNSFLLSPWLASLADYQNTLTDESSEQSLDHSNTLKLHCNTSDSPSSKKKYPALFNHEPYSDKPNHCQSQQSSEDHETSTKTVKDKVDPEVSQDDSFEREINFSPSSIVNSPPEFFKEVNFLNKSNESFEKFRRTTPSLRRLKIASLRHSQEEEDIFHISGSNSDNGKEYPFSEYSEDLFDSEELLQRRY